MNERKHFIEGVVECLKLEERKPLGDGRSDAYYGEFEGVPVSALVVQKRPYTVCFMASVEDKVTVVEFAKVCYPDRWDAEYGTRLVMEKCASSLWKAVNGREEAD